MRIFRALQFLKELQVVNNKNPIINMSRPRKNGGISRSWHLQVTICSAITSNIRPSIKWLPCNAIPNQHYSRPHITQLQDKSCAITVFSCVKQRTLKSHLQRKFRQPFNHVYEITLIAPLFCTRKLILLPAFGASFLW
jgi:hypothetical protein